MNTDPILDAALDYLKRGFSVIPVSQTKKPLIKWEEYQHRRPTEEEVLRWFQDPQTQVAVVTGAISGIVVVDVEAGGSIGEFPKTATAKTGGGGWHLWYKHPGYPVANAVKIKPLVDIRADGGYVLAPPSLHSSGNRYEWLISLDKQPLADFPAHLFSINQESKQWKKALGEVPEGERNETMVSYIGRLLHDLSEDLWEEVAWPSAQAKARRWNYPGAHPYTEAEARKEFDSIAERERQQRHTKRDKRPQGTNPPKALATYSPADHWPEPPDDAAYYGLAGQIVRILEPHSEADPIALLVQLLLAFGNVEGRGPHAVAEDDLHSLNLFAVLVGETSKGRKGTAWGRVLKRFEEIDRTWAMDRVVSGLSSGEGLIWAVRDPITKWDSESNQPEVVDEGVSDKRITVLEPEFARTLRVLQREGSTLSAIIRESWDTGNLRSLTKNSPAVATNAHVSIIGHITRQELLRHLDNTEAGNGFANRFMWICVRRSRYLPEGGKLDPSALDSQVEQLKQCVSFARSVGKIERDNEARKIWAEIYEELSRGEPGLLGAILGRAEAIVMRLSCIYALLDMSATVKSAHLKAALALWEYCEASARYIFGTRLGYPVADEILKGLKNSPKGLTKTDIHHLFSGNRSAGQIDKALGFLLEQGLACPNPEETLGRKAERWFFT